MKLRNLESYISSRCLTTNFNKKANIQLEQYSTPIRTAAELILTIDSNQDLQYLSVADLGCGCGILSVALEAMQANVLAVDLDLNCLQITHSCSQSIQLLQCDVLKEVPLKSQSLDLVVTNPPFGTRKFGADWKFIQESLRLAPIVYSFHKSTSQNFLIKKCVQFDIKHEKIACIDFPLPSLYKSHKKKLVMVDVDIWRFENQFQQKKCDLLQHDYSVLID